MGLQFHNNNSQERISVQIRCLGYHSYDSPQIKEKLLLKRSLGCVGIKFTQNV